MFLVIVIVIVVVIVSCLVYLPHTAHFVETQRGGPATSSIRPPKAGGNPTEWSQKLQGAFVGTSPLRVGKEEIHHTGNKINE